MSVSFQKSRRLVAAALVLALSVPAAALAAPEPASAPAAPAAGDQAVARDLKVSRDQAVALARQTFGIGQDMGEPRVSLNQSTRPNERSVWNLNWETPAKKLPRLWYNIGVDAMTGEIVNYSFERQGEEQQPPLKYTRQAAQGIAANWLQRLAPDYKAKVRLKEERFGQPMYWGGPATYTYAFERIEAGYPVANQGLNFTVDARTGELKSFHRNWEPGRAFKVPSSIVAPAEAEAAITQYVPMTLSYRRFYKPGVDKPEWGLVYAPRMGYYPAVDAASGRLLDSRGERLDLSKLQEPARLEGAYEPYRKPAAPLTRDQALALAQKVSDRKDAPTRSYYNEHPEGATWNFSWYKDGPLEQGERNTDVNIDAVNGVVLHFGGWGPEPSPEERGEPTVTEEAARKAAVSFILKYRPDLAPDLRILPTEQSPEHAKERLARGGKLPPRTQWNFSFQLLRKGIPLLGSQARVAVDAYTGEIRNFWADMESGAAASDLPDPKGAITPHAAMAAFLKYAGLTLTWFSYGGYWDTGEEPRSQLVYAPDPGRGFSLDGFTGHPVDDQGRDLVELSARPEDIAGHPAQKEIELLLGRGVFEVKGGKFEPARQVTRAEAARWLVLARGLRPVTAYDFYGAFGGKGGEAVRLLAKSEAAPFFGAALQSGIITPEDVLANTDPQAVVSREEFALWSARAMGYGAVVRMEVRIPMAYTDADQVGARFHNAVALLAGLKAINAEGAYRPQDTIVRGEAAVMLFAVSNEPRRY